MKDNKITPWSDFEQNSDLNPTIINFFPSLIRDDQRNFQRKNQKIKSERANSQKLKTEKVSNFGRQRDKKLSSKSMMKMNQKDTLSSKRNAIIQEEKRQIMDLLGHNLILKLMKKRLNEEINPFYDFSQFNIYSKDKQDKKIQKMNSSLVSYENKQKEGTSTIQLINLKKYNSQQLRINQIGKVKNQGLRKQRNLQKQKDEEIFYLNLQNSFSKNSFLPVTNSKRQYSKNGGVLRKKYNSLKKYDQMDLNQFYF